VRGHQFRGKKHSPEWSQNQSRGLKSAWKDESKFSTMRHQTRELVEKRCAPRRGRPVPEETRAAISKALTGRKLSEEHRLASLKGLLRPTDLPPEAEARRRQSIAKALTGTHGFGRDARDRPDHHKALHWIIRDPRGVIHEFDNLQSWCRANEHRFLPDERPMSKLALWQRAVGGFNNLQRTDGKAGHQWRGWTLVSVMERKELGAPDLLGRENQIGV